MIARREPDIPEYLHRIARPKLHCDLREAEFISIDSSGMFLKRSQRARPHPDRAQLSNTLREHLEDVGLGKEGLGIGILDDEFGDAEPRVRRVLPELEPLLLPVWLVVQRGLDTSQRVRVVFDLLVAELASPRRNAVEPGRTGGRG